MISVVNVNKILFIDIELVGEKLVVVGKYGVVIISIDV